MSNLDKPGDGVQKTPEILPFTEVINMTKGNIIRLIGDGNTKVEVATQIEVKRLIAKALGLSTSHITGKKRNSTKYNLRAVSLYAYTLREKIRMSNKEIKDMNGYSVSESTISRWIERGQGEVENSPTTKKLYDAITYIGF